MRVLRIYVDTSVIGGCLDEEFAADSGALLQMARDGMISLLISKVLADELETAPVEVQEILATLPLSCMEPISPTDETENLRDAYLAAEVVSHA